jgi:hypothetical protein
MGRYDYLVSGGREAPNHTEERQVPNALSENDVDLILANVGCHVLRSGEDAQPVG